MTRAMQTGPWPLVGALIAAVLLAIMATTPPRPVDASAAPGQFSSGRAMADVRAVASVPHPTGSSENARVRAHLLARLAALGLQTSAQTGTLDARGQARLAHWAGRHGAEEGPAVPLVNLIGVLPGRDRRLPAVMLMAHHDSVWGSPAAADDGAGVAATLEVVRALRHGGQAERDLIVLFTDGEELGLQGAKLFFAAHPLRTRIGAVVNMEARGGGGRTVLFQTSSRNGAAARLYAAAVAHPGASSLAIFVYSVLPNDTDLTPVLKGPYLGYNFAFIGRPGLYHSPLATPERLDEGSLQDMGGQVLALTRALLTAPQLPPAAPDVVFFDVFGLLTVVYPTWAGWLVLAAAAAGLGLVLRRAAMAGAGEGAARMAGLLIGAGLLLTALNWLSIGSAPVNYYDRLAAIPRLEAMALAAGLGAFVLAFGARALPAGGQVGAALPLLGLALALQIAAPTAAYVIALPLLFTAAALNLPSAPVRALLASVTLGYMLALGHQLMQGVGPTMPAVASLPLAIGALAVLPLWPGLKRSRQAAATVVALAAALSLWVQLDAPAESRAVYSDYANHNK
ncbi:MAG: M28 family peptidase [Sphingomonadales bacterium]|nr:M28 family peptidase [Sphingomonadales bacterium]